MSQTRYLQKRIRKEAEGDEEGAEVSLVLQGLVAVAEIKERFPLAMITLILGDFSVKGFGLKVTAELALPESDLSGQSSSSASAEEGIKPKRLRVSINIPYDDVDALTGLITLAEATDTNGSREIYNIVNQTAAAYRVRQVRFTERFTAQEQDDSQAWAVTFVLVEHRSIPERIEQKRVESAEPSAVPASRYHPAKSEATEETSPGWFESMVASLDSALAGEGNADEI